MPAKAGREVGMKERNVFFTKDQSLILRGIAIIMVVASHYVVWFADLVTCEPVNYAISRLGVYGVTIFFLMSGYGLVKSAGKKEPGWHYWRSRLQNTYVPYLLIAVAIEIWAKSEWTPKRLFGVLTGYEFWFIRNILVFYLAFFVIFKWIRSNWLRIVLLAAVVFGYSWWLMDIGRASFWFVSNPAFVIGALLAVCEKELLKAANTGYPVWLLLLAAMMVWVVKSGMDIRFTPVENCDKMLPGMMAGTIWALLCAQLSCLIPKRIRFLKLLGRISLELYMLHTFIYNWIVNTAGIRSRLMQGAAALTVTLFAAWLLNLLLSWLWRAVEAASKR